MAGISGHAPAAGERVRLRAQREPPEATASGGGVVAVVAGEVDATLVLDLYERFGSELVAALDRACALAVWDAGRGRLLLACDRFGEKPLFYAAAEGGLGFASDPRDLAVGPAWAAVDPDALGALAAGGRLAEQRSPLTGVAALPAGCTLTWSVAGGTELRRYWRLPQASEPGMESGAEMVAEVRRQLGDAVRARLPEEGPAAVLLGGDLDSAVLAGLAAEAGATPLAVICAAEPEATAAARELARGLGLDQRELDLGAEEVAAQVPAVLARQPQPVTDASAIAAQALAAASGELRGALLAAGGELLRSPGPRLRGGLRGLLAGGEELTAAPPTLAGLGCFGLPAAAGLRSPYLDRALAELAVTLPAHAGRGRRLRSPLRDLAAELLPGPPPPRRAAELPSPVAAWLRGPLAEPLETRLAEGELVRHGLVERGPAEAALRAHRAGEDRSAELWPLFACACWLEAEES